jgi:general secretion pathway protein N
MLRIAGYLLFALLVVAITTAVMAPAQWLASAAASATGGRVQLAEARGSVWSGDATLVLASGTDANITRVALPERLSWRLSPTALLLGRVDLNVTHPSALAQPLALRTQLLGGRTELSGTTLRLPAALLAGLGAPFNTLKPGGLLSLQWQQLDLDAGGLKGDINGEWQFATSSLTAVAPFGSYRLVAAGGFPGTRLTLQTLNGPLELSGDGTIETGGRVRFNGRAKAAATADAAGKGQLSGFISLLGRREGESAILRLGN